MLLAIVILQAPAGFVYFANTFKYREFISTSLDLNMLSVFTLLIYTFVRLLKLHLYVKHFIVALLTVFNVAHLYSLISHSGLAFSALIAFDLVCRVSVLFYIWLFHLFGLHVNMIVYYKKLAKLKSC